MTDRMRDDQFESEIRTFLAWQAGDVADAPTAAEMATRIGARAGARTLGPRTVPQLVWVLLLVGLLIVALTGAVVVGSMLLRHDPLRTSYEAVFLRREPVNDGSYDMLVVGVDDAGVERQIARLPGAGVAPPPGPVGAVSPSGLLALPTYRGAALMRWEIFDLHRPQAKSIVIAGMKQDFELLRETPYWKVNGRGGIFWGPGERLANLWYPSVGGEVHLQLSVIDGRTGNATALTIPAGLVVLPSWASDGSGVFVGYSTTDVTPRRLLRLDGTVVDAPAALAESSCRMPVGFALACLAPDDSMIADIDGGTTSSVRGARLISQVSGASFEIQGSFAGWLEVSP